MNLNPLFQNLKSFFRNGFFKTTALFLVLILLAGTIPFQGCTPKPEPITKVGFYFNTYITIVFYDSQDAALYPECEELCGHYEAILSRTVPGSDIWEINHAGGKPVTVNDETAGLIQTALSFCSLTDGAVDITIAPLMDLWAFTEDIPNHEPPTEQSIQEALKHVDYRKVSVTDNTVTLSDPEAQIDLGFIAKGFIADRLKDFLVSKGVESAIINLGGNIQLIGCKPDGGDYSIGVKKPFTQTDEILTSVPLRDTSFVTSGIYERCFEYNGEFYHHILDPKTGYPVKNNLYQVSVLCPESVIADGCSTVLLLLGQEKGMEILPECGENVHAIFVDDRMQMTYSPDFPE